MREGEAYVSPWCVGEGGDYWSSHLRVEGGGMVKSNRLGEGEAYVSPWCAGEGEDWCSHLKV